MLESGVQLLPHHGVIFLIRDMKGAPQAQANPFHKETDFKKVQLIGSPSSCFLECGKVCEMCRNPQAMLMIRPRPEILSEDIFSPTPPAGLYASAR
jgi:hypothetical protein